MTINNPPVFNRIIASGGQIGTVAVSGKTMTWQFDGSDATVDSLITAQNNNLRIASSSVAWNMDTTASVLTQFFIAPNTVIMASLMLLNQDTSIRYPFNIGPIQAGDTIVTTQGISVELTEVGGFARFTLSRDNTSRYNAVAFNDMVASITIAYNS